MPLFKKSILVLLISAVHAYLLKWLFDAFEFRGPGFAFLANCVTVSWVALAGQFVPFRLGSPYYRIRPFERNGRFYDKFGIRLFQKLVGSRPWAVLNPTLRFSGNVAQLADLERGMQTAEAGHLLAFLAVSLAAVLAAAQGWLDAAGWLSLFNIPLNLYPVMLQRRNRARIQAIQGRTPGKSEEGPLSGGE